MKTFTCVLLSLTMWVAISPVANGQGDNMCPRGAYVSVHAYKDVGVYSPELVADSSFTISTFLSNFGQFFSSPRLALKPSQHPEYSLTVTFLKFKAHGREPEQSFLAIVLGFIGCELRDNDASQAFPGTFGGQIFSSGAALLTITTKAEGLDPASHIPLVRSEMSKQKSLDDIIVAYEQIPVTATVDEDPWCGYDPNNPNPYQIDFKEIKAAVPPPPGPPLAHSVRFVARAEKGWIENGDHLKDDRQAKAFSVAAVNISRVPLTILYRPPEGGDPSDVVTLYNSCEVCGPNVVPMYETKRHTKIAEMKVNCRERWSVQLSYTKKINGKEQLTNDLSRMLGGSYSATVKAIVEYVRSKGSDRIFESKSATLDLNDTFWQHIVAGGERTCEGRISWTGTHQGTIQVPVIMTIHTKANKVGFGFGRHDEPISYNMSVNLWGDPRCGGAKAWSGQSSVKDVLFGASGDEPDHPRKPISYQRGQKQITDQDQFSTKFWLVRSWAALKLPIEQFPQQWRPMLMMLYAGSMTSPKIPADVTVNVTATKLAQKE